MPDFATLLPDLGNREITRRISWKSLILSVLRSKLTLIALIKLCLLEALKLTTVHCRTVFSFANIDYQDPAGLSLLLPEHLPPGDRRHGHLVLQGGRQEQHGHRLQHQGHRWDRVKWWKFWSCHTVTVNNFSEPFLSRNCSELQEWVWIPLKPLSLNLLLGVQIITWWLYSTILNQKLQPGYSAVLLHCCSSFRSICWRLLRNLLKNKLL